MRSTVAVALALAARHAIVGPGALPHGNAADAVRLRAPEGDEDVVEDLVFSDDEDDEPKKSAKKAKKKKKRF